VCEQQHHRPKLHQSGGAKGPELHSRPGNAAGTIVAVGASPVHVYNYFGRVDVNLSPKNVLFGHFYIDHNSTVDPTSAGTLSTFMADAYGLQTTMAVLGDTYTVNPT